MKVENIKFFWDFKPLVSKFGFKTVIENLKIERLNFSFTVTGPVTNLFIRMIKVGVDLSGRHLFRSDMLAWSFDWSIRGHSRCRVMTLPC